MDVYAFERRPAGDPSPRTKPVDVTIPADGELPLGVVLNQDVRNVARNQKGDADVLYAGPLFGSFAAAGVWAASAVSSSPILLALAFFGFYLNFFNLIAIPPLDGGRVTKPGTDANSGVVPLPARVDADAASFRTRTPCRRSWLRRRPQGSALRAGGSS